MTLKTSLAMVALVTTSLVAAQGPGHEAHHAKAQKRHARQSTAGGMMGGMDMAQCMRDMESGQKRLEELAAKMNSAQGADRIDATSAVVNEMIKQQGEMMQMCHMMMSHPMMGGQPRGGAGKAAPRSSGAAHNHHPSK